MSKSSYSVWFKSQYGGLPASSSKMNALYDKRRTLQAQLDEVNLKIKHHHRLEDAWRDAGYGWNASERLNRASASKRGTK